MPRSAGRLGMGIVVGGLLAMGSTQKQVRLFTDEKQEYPRVLGGRAQIRRLGRANRFQHLRISSKVARTLSNPLFAVNYMDRELRKDLHEHTRETVCFARNVNNSMERLWVYVGLHNYRKLYRERQPAGIKERHCERAGLREQLVERSFQGFTSRRRFLSLEPIGEATERVWRRQYRTPLRGADPLRLRQLLDLGRKGLSWLILQQLSNHISIIASGSKEYLPAYALA